MKKVLKLIFIITMILLFIGILFTIIYMNNPIIAIVGFIILVVLGALFDKLFINTKEETKRLNELYNIKNVMNLFGDVENTKNYYLHRSCCNNKCFVRWCGVF